MGERSPVLLCEHNPSVLTLSYATNFILLAKPREVSRAAAAGGAAPGLNTQELNAGTDLTPPLPTSCHLGVGTVTAFGFSTAGTAGNPSCKAHRETSKWQQPGQERQVKENGQALISKAAHGCKMKEQGKPTTLTRVDLCSTLQNKQKS